MSFVRPTAARKIRKLVALASLLVLLASNAYADDADTELQRGRERYDAKDFPAAIAAWESVITTAGEERAWRVLYNLGLAYQESGDVTRAAERFEAFLSRLSKETGSLSPELEDRRQDAAERVRTLRATNGELDVRATTEEVALVRVGALAPRPAGFSLLVKPGPVVIEVAPGTERARTISVIAEAGKVTRVDAVPAPRLPSALPPLPPRPVAVERRTFPTGLVAVSAGLTVASFALPTALGLIASGKRRDAEAINPGDTRYALARQDFESARSAYTLSYVLPALLGATTLTIATVGLARRGTIVTSGSLGPGGAWLAGRF